MSKHTPGPWQIKSDYEPLSIIGNIDGPDDGQYHYTPICEVEPTLFADENTANARLIAAAPELLDALRALVWAVENDKTRPAVLNVARAAIAKATGETNV